MKFIFIVQGEGRGHMTQAISLFDQLTKLGHEVSDVLIGRSNRRTLPQFVKENIKTNIIQFDSPNFITDQKEKSINISKTLRYNFLKTGRFYNSLKLIDQTVQQSQPDVIVNFYDLLAGIYNFIFRPKSSFWAIGHQYLIYHPEFPFASGSPIQKVLFKFNTWITALNADKLLALSFRNLNSGHSKKLSVLPPLLRPQVKALDAQKGDFILTYMVNSGYAEEAIAFAKKNPHIKIEAFWDKKDMPNPYMPSANLTFHQINDVLFLEKMASCKGLISTAGFESICEAMYFGKKVMMIPVKGQYEQACNALDASISEAGILHHEFDFEKFDNFLNLQQEPHHIFVNWEKLLRAKLLEILELEETSSYSRSPIIPKYADS
ncbi:glycosyltransferase family protein [Echinicola sp. 20G]|uniref:glycosyltransferase family protein n=1 Tax=Echinicola sp. 20G TaxID=2781961 RepID=UPI0019101A80|nr:glycosyltransferase family protein [Echinicola sp. 20G]